MDTSGDRRADAARHAYHWACVAGNPDRAWTEREKARDLSNIPGELSEWQRWLLDHLKGKPPGVEQAMALADMWVRVAAVQPTAGSGPEGSRASQHAVYEHGREDEHGGADPQ